MQKLQLLKIALHQKILSSSRRNIILLLISIFLFGLLWYTFSEKKILHSSLYRIAYDNSSFPNSQQQRSISAFSMELILAIAKEEGIQVELIRTSPEHLYVGLENREYDAVFSFLLPNVSNKKLYFFSDPLYLNGPVLVVKESTDIESLKQMEGKTIGISMGTSMIFDISQYPSFLLISFDNIQQALTSLSKNNIDGVILDLIPAYAYTTGLYAGKLKIGTRPLTEEGLRLITLHNPISETFIKHIDNGLHKLKTSNSYKALAEKWSIYLPAQ